MLPVDSETTNSKSVTIITIKQDGPTDPIRCGIQFTPDIDEDTIKLGSHLVGSMAWSALLEIAAKFNEMGSPDSLKSIN